MKIKATLTASVACVDGDDSPRSLSQSAESMASCSLDSSDHEESDRTGEPTPAARPESLPPVAISLVSEMRSAKNTMVETKPHKSLLWLPFLRRGQPNVPHLTDLPPANPQRSRKKTASHRGEPMPAAAGPELPPPVAISLVVSDDDSDEQ